MLYTRTKTDLFISFQKQLSQEIRKLVNKNHDLSISSTVGLRIWASTMLGHQAEWQDLKDFARKNSSLIFNGERFNMDNTPSLNSSYAAIFIDPESLSTGLSINIKKATGGNISKDSCCSIIKKALATSKSALLAIQKKQYHYLVLSEKDISLSFDDAVFFGPYDKTELKERRSAIKNSIKMHTSNKPLSIGNDGQPFSIISDAKDTPFYNLKTNANIADTLIQEITPADLIKVHEKIVFNDRNLDQWLLYTAFDSIYEIHQRTEDFDINNWGDAPSHVTEYRDWIDGDSTGEYASHYHHSALLLYKEYQVLDRVFPGVASAWKRLQEKHLAWVERDFGFTSPYPGYFYEEPDTQITSNIDNIVPTITEQCPNCGNYYTDAEAELAGVNGVCSTKCRNEHMASFMEALESDIVPLDTSWADPLVENSQAVSNTPAEK